MAYIDQNQALLDDQDQQNQQGLQSGGDNSLVGQSSNDVGSGQVSTAGIGPGGTGGWTNIQAYLNANKNDTGSAQALDRTVGGQFNQEKEKFTQDSSKFLGDATKQVDDAKVSNDQADQIIGQAAGLYSYNQPKPTIDYGGGKGGVRTPTSGVQEKVTPGNPSYQAPVYDASMDYQGLVGKMNSALTDQYSGPREYNYGFSDKTQEYGTNLSDNGGFDTLMNQVYSDSAGKPLSSGLYQLQKQLDVNNENLVGARNQLKDQYGQLTADRDKTVSDTTAGLTGLEKTYRQNQSALSDYLGEKANTFDQQIGKAESDARKEYGNVLNTSKSGYDSIERQKILDYMMGNTPGYYDPTKVSAGVDEEARRKAAGIWGDDLTFGQLENEARLVPNGTFAGVPDLQERKRALDSFYFDQDSKYADTADNEERAWNSIQDFLNSSAPRKEQGFKLRG